MKKRLILFLISAVVLFTGCNQDAVLDRLEDLENRVAKLEKLCQRMNTDLQSFSSIINALKENVSIESVVPLTENGKVVGHTVKFTDGTSIDIYDGEDGKDAQDGSDVKPEDIPVVGIKMDTDGIYYWTVNGEWLLDDEGEKMVAISPNGENGDDGKPGQDGADGKDGITPVMKIENGEWYVSVDNGETWELIGKSSGEDGKPGQDGKSFFEKVDTSHPDYVLFVLADGTEIKVPTWSAFEELKNFCDGMNDNLTSLTRLITALETRDYIESVTPIYDDALLIGYSIQFHKMESITIYTGRDGASVPGVQMPQIGVAKADDGIYYWTLDGEWMLDNTWRKVPVESPSGEQGDSGKNGFSPELKIEDGYWFVSTPEGSWRKLSPAVGEDGQDGAPGVPLFSDVREDERYLYLELSNGETLQFPKYSDHFMNKITSLTYVPDYSDGSVVVSTQVDGSHRMEVSFIIDPSEVLSDLAASWNQYLRMKAYVKSQEGITSMDLDILSFTSNELEGEFSVSVSGDMLDPAFYEGSQNVSAVLSISDGELGIQSEEIVLRPEDMKDPATGMIIVYTTTDGKAIAASESSGNLFWSDVIGNVYDSASGEGFLKLKLSTSEVSMNAFRNIANLKSIILDSRFRSIGAQAFQDCSALESIVLPAGLEILPQSVFKSCSALTQVEIPATVTQLECESFMGCTALSEIVLPSGIVKISNNTFGNCTALKTIYCSPVIPPAISQPFVGCSTELKILVPMASLEAYQSNYWWRGLSEMIFGFEY